MAIDKQVVSHYLRKFRLLRLADYLMFLRDALKNRKSNQSFLKEHPGFIAPPAHLAFDAYNHTNWQAYYETGMIHAKLISDLVKEHISGDQIRICEWGCGPARVIRHLSQIDGFGKIELFGTDYNVQSVKWCRDHIKNVRFMANKLEPTLPLEPGQFDCVYAISIFTHLSEKLHYAWIEELFRIMKPGGILIFTTHGDVAAKRLLPEEKEKYDSGLLVTKSRTKEGKKLFAAYHPPKWVRERLLKNYVVVKHINDASGYQLGQEVWCVKKRG